jgi:hypothetical protein
MSELHPLHHGAPKHPTTSIPDLRKTVYVSEAIKDLDDTFGITVNPGFYLDRKRISLVEDLSGTYTKQQAKKTAHVGTKALMHAPSAPKI